MKIGVVGKPGSGKTAFAEALAKYLPSSYVPDTQTMCENAKRKKDIVIGSKLYAFDESERGEAISYILSELKTEGIFVSEIAEIEEMIEVGLSKLVLKYISDEIEEKKPKGKGFVIVDYEKLGDLEEFYPCEFIYMVCVDEKTRCQRLIARESKARGKKFTGDEIKRYLSEVESRYVEHGRINDFANNNGSVDEEAKKKAKVLLSYYPTSEINDMMLNEINYVIKLIEDAKSSPEARLKLKEKVSLIRNLKGKIKFLYEEGFIDKECYRSLLKEQRKI